MTSEFRIHISPEMLGPRELAHEPMPFEKCPHCMAMFDALPLLGAAPGAWPHWRKPAPDLTTP